MSYTSNDLYVTPSRLENPNCYLDVVKFLDEKQYNATTNKIKSHADKIKCELIQGIEELLADARMSSKGVWN